MFDGTTVPATGYPLDPALAAAVEAVQVKGAAVVVALSDTHGRLDSDVFALVAAQDPDLIVHAGDICGDDILPRLEMLAPVVAVLGNNDYSGEYGPRVRRSAQFELLGVDFEVAHILSSLGVPVARVAICGHTHMPKVEVMGCATIVNPGSVSRPRDRAQGRTIARIDVGQGYLRAVRILSADEGAAR